MCLYPKLLPNKKYTKTKKNGGNIPPVIDQRVLKVPIGCGNCIECTKQKARNWQIRLSEEVKRMTNGKFVTLTFRTEALVKLAEEHKELSGYPLDNQIATTAVRRFLERWRKKYKTSVRHWLVTELGHKNTEHLHLHGILWTDANGEDVQQLWQYGHIWRGYEQEPKVNGWSKKLYVNQATVTYITKYINKVDTVHQNYKPKIFTSSGIGKDYEISENARNNKFKGTKTDETYRTNKGDKIGLPTYYRNKIYSESEREQLWLNKLDENIRWVMGVKIKADDHEAYLKTLEHAQRVNRELGYGSDQKDWNQEVYEQERRRILMEKRKDSLRRGNSKDIGFERDPET